MTQDQKEMKHIVEKAGGCWHEHSAVITTFGGRLDGEPTKCKHCGLLMPVQSLYESAIAPYNPSPGDLNALVELAEKFGFWRIAFHRGVYKRLCFLNDDVDHIGRVDCDEPHAAALRKALYQATGGE